MFKTGNVPLVPELSSVCQWYDGTAVAYNQVWKEFMLAFAVSRLDYCHALLISLTTCLTSSRELREMLVASCHPTSRDLHWLPAPGSSGIQDRLTLWFRRSRSRLSLSELMSPYLPGVRSALPLSLSYVSEWRIHFHSCCWSGLVFGMSILSVETLYASSVWTKIFLWHTQQHYNFFSLQKKGLGNRTISRTTTV